MYLANLKEVVGLG